ncbi:DNA-3-methyladenine glycosylase I [Methylogaea oryzae]|uniref:DNA-3-methyladenine glycosylase I n=1 Tax=Methylogaea oryzae TaxID=1295382 RepID=A0A8D4VUG5_9GAMM|nr:DNA-3-methyladenine glycosylase I [Methylogaea oryzae]BBL72867.1 DNA-3-methyladenine glycosylase [Methylogaea oryzae]
MEPIRCPWCEGFGLYRDYHDREWGTPLVDDRALFELLILEGAQAGLSWSTILKKREAYRLAYEGFDPAVIADYGEADAARLLADAGIVRNRAKVAASIRNARAYLELAATAGSFTDYLWAFVDGEPLQNAWTSMAQVPASTPQSESMSRALTQAGFKFVGPTICYAFMQAAGMVNDHLVSCFRHGQVKGLRRIA